MKIFSAGRTDVGRKRENNEDSFYTDDQVGLYVVADGMGGHRAGEVASSTVVSSVKDYMEGLSHLPRGPGDRREQYGRQRPQPFVTA